MKKNIRLLLIVVILLQNLSSAISQRNCATNDNLQLMIKEHPEIQKTMDEIEKQTEAYIREPKSGQRAVITIPVVFHIVWRSAYPAENISDAQVMSQLAAMNKDFAKLNADISKVPSLFAPLAADCEIQFCLAQRSPAATATNGIVHYQSSRSTSWGTADAVKTAFAPWDPTRYLNIWVCNIGSGILGYAQFPGGSMATDGVVIDYRYFGTSGTATAPFNLGRTVTHEVGHWLNLRHIWGDASCGSDLVSDTPTHTTSNGGCPVFPKINSCGGVSNTEMTMNFMDYTDDACMYMFTLGQKTRMKSLFATGGARASLLNSDGCIPVSATSCPPPSGIVISGVTSNSTSISWNAVVNVISYSVRYKSSTATSWIVLNANSNSMNLTALNASTAYTVQVATICSGAASSYSASLGFSTLAAAANCADSFEPNNSMTTAVAIATGAPIKAVISTSTDDDWFKVSTTATQKKIKVTLYDLPEDYDLFLYSSAGSLLASSKNLLNSVETVAYNNGAGSATYYVRVVSTLKKYASSVCYSLFPEISSGNFRIAEKDFRKAEDAAAPSFVLSPNPVQNLLRIQFQGKIADKGCVSVYDISGKKHRQFIAGETLDSDSFSIDVSELPEGIYFLLCDEGLRRFTRKFIVSR